MKLEEVSQLIWAAQGTTAKWGGRTAPSAGALYPLEVYLAVGTVDKLIPGVYKYKPEGHELVTVGNKDARKELAGASVGQTWMKEGAIHIVIAAVYDEEVKGILGMPENEAPLYIIPVGRKR